METVVDTVVFSVPPSPPANVYGMAGIYGLHEAGKGSSSKWEVVQSPFYLKSFSSSSSVLNQHMGSSCIEEEEGLVGHCSVLLFSSESVLS